MRILLMGYRAPLAEALETMGIPYVIWNDAELKLPPPGVTVHVAPFGDSDSTSRAQAAKLTALGPFDHVIAGTERAVVAASHARRLLGARLSRHTTVRRCHDKLAMKLALRDHNIPMADFIDGNQAEEWDEVHRQLGSPVILKSRRSSGGDGIDRVEPSMDPKPALRHRLAERFVDAPEASVESFVVGGEIVFENVTEYYRKGHINIVPATTELDQPDGIRSISRRVIDTLKISWGMTHLESFMPAAGPLFGEVALRPPGGYIMELISLAYDFDAWQAFASVEVDRPFEFPSEPSAHAASIILHPGAGRVRRVSGLKAVRSHPNVVKARLNVAAGDDVQVRQSVGKSVGHLMLRASGRQELIDAIGMVDETLQIELSSPPT